MRGCLSRRAGLAHIHISPLFQVILNIVRLFPSHQRKTMRWRSGCLSLLLLKSTNEGNWRRECSHALFFGRGYLHLYVKRSEVPLAIENVTSAPARHHLAGSSAIKKVTKRKRMERVSAF